MKRVILAGCLILTGCSASFPGDITPKDVVAAINEDRKWIQALSSAFTSLENRVIALEPKPKETPKPDAKATPKPQ